MTKKNNFELGNCELSFSIKPSVNFKELWEFVCGNGRVKHKEDYFIKKFSEVVTHEIIHAEIFEIMLDLFMEKEEEIVDKLVGSK